jgi:DNA-binding LacI/PurR family transcriptional regulator
LDKTLLGGIDGLFCATDLMAIGALDGIRLGHGMSVPEDIQVLGFDDIEQAGWAAYDLSTIQQDVDAQSDTAIRLLTERIQNRRLPKRIIRLGLSSVMRGTTRND